jgi:hypothetical protein
VSKASKKTVKKAPSKVAAAKNVTKRTAVAKKFKGLRREKASQ